MWEWGSYKYLSAGASMAFIEPYRNPSKNRTEQSKQVKFAVDVTTSLPTLLPLPDARCK